MIGKEKVKIDIIDSEKGTVWIVARAIAIIPIKHELEAAIFPFTYFGEYNPEEYCMQLNTCFGNQIQGVRNSVIQAINQESLLLYMPDGSELHADINHKKMNELEWVTFLPEGKQVLDFQNKTMFKFLNNSK